MRIYLAIQLSFAAVLAQFSAGPAWSQGTPIVFADQGVDWTQTKRAEFYSRDQGSRMIPLDWLKALKQANGQPFLADGLARYGYLPNPANPNGLPVGFNASGLPGAETVGMTCSACHTRQINVGGQAYRIDGGPAIVEFQSLLSDLDAAVGSVLTSDATFAPFARAVLGPSVDPADVATLRRNADGWYLRYHTLILSALPKQPWGPSRLDAVGMIFNRLTGLDLGPPPSFLIPGNIKVADAPVRYPFLWNAARQELTQWSGFADNGSDVLALGRNLGEVFGVFGVFQPEKKTFFIDYLNNNSANFEGLRDVENLIKLIGPPRWPWPLDQGLVAQGKVIFSDTAQGDCARCHAVAEPGKTRFPDDRTLATPVQGVGTDTLQYDILNWSASSGVLQGAFIPGVTKSLKETDLAFNILRTSVVGSIVDHVLTGGGATLLAMQPNPANPQGFTPTHLTGKLPTALKDLQGAFKLPGYPAEGLENPPLSDVPALTGAPAPARGKYEARVMQGIWAAAPYLHNGSVPTLAELLKPASERVAAFKIGPAYDIANVGLATEQTQFGYTLTTTDCSQLNSGNSRCGHEFGTRLAPDQKRALLEYLKSL